MRLAPLLILLCAAVPATPLWDRPSVEIDYPPAHRLPKVVCLSESCRFLIPFAQKWAADDGYPSAVIVQLQGDEVSVEGWAWPQWMFELQAETYWPDCLIVYRVMPDPDDDDRDG